MLKIIKNFFNDNEGIIGLCAFEKNEKKSSQRKDYFYNEFHKKCYYPEMDKNILLFS